MRCRGHALRWRRRGLGQLGRAGFHRGIIAIYHRSARLPRLGNSRKRKKNDALDGYSTQHCLVASVVWFPSLSHVVLLRRFPHVVWFPPVVEFHGVGLPPLDRKMFWHVPGSTHRVPFFSQYPNRRYVPAALRRPGKSPRGNRRTSTDRSPAAHIPDNTIQPYAHFRAYRHYGTPEAAPAGASPETHRNSLILLSYFSGVNLARRPKRVHTSVNAARMSACATNWLEFPPL